jgi:ABC-2 type transport system permease protein
VGAALPLVLQFSFTKEIEDRLLAPIPTARVAVEKDDLRGHCVR